jgi:hypothetical protein
MFTRGQLHEGSEGNLTAGRIELELPELSTLVMGQIKSGTAFGRPAVFSADHGKIFLAYTIYLVYIRKKFNIWGFKIP